MSDRAEIDAIMADIKSEEAAIGDLKRRAADSQEHSQIVAICNRIDERFATLSSLKLDLKLAIERWEP